MDRNKLKKAMNDLRDYQQQVTQGGDRFALGLILRDMQEALGSIRVFDVTLSDEEVDFIRSHNPIQAIKEIRSRTGLTLAQSKNIVEAAIPLIQKE